MFQHSCTLYSCFYLNRVINYRKIPIDGVEKNHPLNKIYFAVITDNGVEGTDRLLVKLYWWGN